MFGELPKILDRNFIVGYALPASAFLAALAFNHGVDLPAILTTLQGASFAAATLTLGIVLLATNRSVLRLLEGYGRVNPARLMIRIQRRRFRRLDEELDRADREYNELKAQKADIPAELDLRASLLIARFAERWPDEEKLVLPTAFGNAVRAFERYPFTMYNLRIIEGWNRLIAVIPKDFLDQIDSAKAGTDLWVNAWFLSLLVVADTAFTWHFPYLLQFGGAEPLAPAIDPPYVKPLLMCVFAMGFAFFSSWMAVRAAVEWGSVFKAAVDVYLPALYERLGFVAPADPDELRRNWDDFSYAVAYRARKKMPARRWLPGSGAVRIYSAKVAAVAAPAPAQPATPAPVQTGGFGAKLTSQFGKNRSAPHKLPSLPPGSGLQDAPQAEPARDGAGLGPKPVAKQQASDSGDRKV